MQLLLFGPPGAGKGTQAAMIAETWRIPHVSTGDIFRANMRDGTELGQKAQEYVTKGELVPNEIVIAMALDRIGQKDCAEGFLLDGFPRDVEQARQLENWLNEHGRKVTAVLSVTLDDETIIQRIISRRVCKDCGATYNLHAQPPKKEGICDQCGGSVIQRPDDQRETIENRLKVYQAQTAPVESFYGDRGVLVKISGSGSVEGVFARIKEAVEKLR
ncbi:MAG: adenylate kinase [bacterium]